MENEHVHLEHLTSSAHKRNKKKKERRVHDLCRVQKIVINPKFCPRVAFWFTYC